ncbi:hypothetical protein ES702_02637 [subsurface metagenome]
MIFEKLSVRDENELRQFLKSSWVVKIYSEFCTATQASDLSLRCLSGANDCTNSSRSPHLWKLEQALCVLELPGDTSRYGSENPDLTSWTEDDHDIHLIVRAARLGSVGGQVWHKDHQSRGWTGPCHSALWLLLWFKWIQKTTKGQSSWTHRIQRKREMWLAFMEGLVGGHYDRAVTSSSTAENSRSTTYRESPNDATSITSINNRAQADAKQKAGQQLFLVSSHARDLYIRNRNNRLSAWGVGTNHEGTCVLVPASWAATDPVSLIEHTEAWPTEGSQTSRLVSWPAI